MSATFASVELRTLFRQRMGQLCGVGVALGAVVLLVALVSYNPHDPSLNTATSRPATNLLGLAGATVSDVLVQYFGLAGGLPVMAMLAWAYRIATARPLRLGTRVLFLVLALPVLASVLTMIPVMLGVVLPRAGAVTWPGGVGLGGAVGVELGRYGQGMGRGLIGPAGDLVVVGVEALLAVVLGVLALGLTAGEWRRAGRGAVGVARGSVRGSVRGGRDAAEVMARTATGVAGAARAVSEPVRRFLEPRPEAALPEVDELVEDRRGVESIATAVAREAAVVAPAAGAVRPAVAVKKGASVSFQKGPAPGQQSLPLVENGWQFPPLSLLSEAPRRGESGPSEDALQANARLLETVLNDYGVQGTIREIRPGPVVTLYELEPAPGIRSARVIGLADDVARSLSVTAVRIATVSGRNVIGIEVPNAKRETVFLSELLGSGDWASHPGKLALAIGKDIGGTPVIADLARMPHLLIAGTTGSGKSVGINAMILSILFRLSPDQCRLIMIDPKMLELSVYEGIPHLLAPVVTEPAKAVTALKWTTREMERRYRAMSQLGVRNVGGYNERVTEALAKGEVVTRRVQTGFDSETGKPIHEEQPLALKPLPYIVVVIDEMADLMMVAGKEVEAAVQRLAQMARAAGIHVIMATQRPSVDVITGTIKANFPTRISYQVISKFDSRTILGEQGAEQLLGMGDLLHMQGGGRIGRVHGPFVADREVEDIVAFLRAQAEPTYDDEVTEGLEDDGEGASSGMTGIAGASDGEKGLFDQAVDIVTREGKASTSFIQRHLSIGYNRAAKLIEQMEKEGVISAANHVGKREVLARCSRDDD
jgi:S-DNA-T family DNA segregation ATPase FtsK/SpoIIIE